VTLQDLVGGKLAEIVGDQDFPGNMTQESKKMVQFSDGAFLEI